MPYSSDSGRFERARRLGHVPITQNPFIREHLREYHIVSEATEYAGISEELLVPAQSINGDAERIKWAIAIDGSNQEPPIREAYPSTRIGYIQIAGVLVNLEQFLGENQSRFVNPARIHESVNESLFSGVVPGSNVTRIGTSSVADSWRLEIYELFSQITIEDRNLLEMLWHLWSDDGNLITIARCPNTQCTGTNLQVDRNGGNCPQCGIDLFPTDVLRIHEEVSEISSNGTALSRLMSILEHLSLLCYLDFLRERQPRVLSNIAFFVDGPLALFGPTAQAKWKIQSYLLSLATDLRRRNHRLPVIVGVEKTGQFVEHATQISDYMQNGTLLTLPDHYIFERILAGRDSNRAYGYDTYYGRKFIYKTRQGNILTLSIPNFDADLFGVENPELTEHYATLPNTLPLLDKVGTMLYKNALIPVALAHSYASIPLSVGSRVLTLLSREFLG